MLHQPSGGAGDGTATADRGPMSIGAVLSLLRDEFPEITISKIRFLESEGLVEPQRTPSGYRKFSAEDVERLTRVLRIQRDHYLPLRVIREHLDAEDRGEPVPLPSPSPPGDAGRPDAPEEPEAPRRASREELLGTVGAEEEQLAEWESYGLVRAESDGRYSAETVATARLVAELGRHGLEARHLRVARAAAEREAGLIEQLVAPLRRHRNPQTRAHAEATARDVAALSARLHAAYLDAAVRDRLR
ncbi:MerR family transcriptional regulator [Streptomyces durbertensis]|uniref:MerR family transcriptional regulator n=1 Tax=Streptomyces durbertensis TaxID=2448886 RepID=A0ABR6EB53_9ACTN|nr:MerR family transcriptional regulator [Streptomyces durbertensis]MBB1242554.1 MerR family transcriptional regulator [Streptomyces durbertensis]